MFHRFQEQATFTAISVNAALFAAAPTFDRSKSAKPAMSHQRRSGILEDVHQKHGGSLTGW
jgi:hypothetical protein